MSALFVALKHLGDEVVVDHCSPHSIQDQLAIAHLAIKDGDLGHAAFHIAAALVVDPANAEVLAVFDAWLSATDNSLGLVSKREDERWVGWIAMQARTHARPRFGLDPAR